MPAGFLLLPPERFNLDHQAAEANLSKLLEHDFDTVYVFHGSHVTEDAKGKLERYLRFKEHYRQDRLEAWHEAA